VEASGCLRQSRLDELVFGDVLALTVAKLEVWHAIFSGEFTTRATGNAAAIRTAGAGERRSAARSSGGSLAATSVFITRIGLGSSGSALRTRLNRRKRPRRSARRPSRLLARSEIVADAHRLHGNLVLVAQPAAHGEQGKVVGDEEVALLQHVRFDMQCVG
jgi:hypothetical protein